MSPRYWRRYLHSEVRSHNAYYDWRAVKSDDISLNWTAFMRVDAMVRGSYTPAPLCVVRALP